LVTTFAPQSPDPQPISGERQLSWSVACLPYSVSIEILHIRSFFHPFSNQNLEYPQWHLNLACKSHFGRCSQSQLSHRRSFYSWQVQQSKWELGRCLPLFPLDFSPSTSTSTSPSPIHLLSRQVPDFPGSFIPPILHFVRHFLREYGVHT
jgi:hypothetical protein